MPLKDKEKRREYNRLYRLRPEVKKRKNIRNAKLRRDPEAIAYMKRYKQEHRDKVRLYNNRPRGRYTRTKKSAEVRRIPFELTFEQFKSIIKEPCYLCGFTSANGDDNKLNGADRVDNNIGYTLNNCKPCCWTCNRMKRDMDRGDFLDHIINILTHLGWELY